MSTRHPIQKQLDQLTPEGSIHGRLAELSRLGHLDFNFRLAPTAGGLPPDVWAAIASVASDVAAVELELASAGLPDSIRTTKTTLTYSASITPDAEHGTWQALTVTDGNAFAVNAPSNPPAASDTQPLTIEIYNTSGGAMGAISWNAAFAFAAGGWANPADGKRRFARFEWNGSKWVCTSVAAGDY
jgi:hypothetical protein